MGVGGLAVTLVDINGLATTVASDANASLITPLIGGFSITPSDSNNLSSITRQIRVTGNSGNMAVVWQDGSETTEPVSAGDVWDWRIVKVKATGTTATGLRGYY